jgi:hypothetical protein
LVPGQRTALPLISLREYSRHPLITRRVRDDLREVFGTPPRRGSDRPTSGITGYQPFPERIIH